MATPARFLSPFAGKKFPGLYTEMVSKLTISEVQKIA